jgi:D-glycero-D-manno-heptose 1,7-bisphosphate phosphatase
VIVTNQSGIARGYYTEDDFRKLNDWMLKKLKAADVDIAKVYYCPHLPDAEIAQYRMECDCRKPKLGMYEQAIKEWHIDVTQSYAIGDKIRDCTICKEGGCRGYLIADNEKEEIISEVKAGAVSGVNYAGNLLEAAKAIVND